MVLRCLTLVFLLQGGLYGPVRRGEEQQQRGPLQHLWRVQEVWQPPNQNGPRHAKSRWAFSKQHFRHVCRRVGPPQLLLMSLTSPMGSAFDLFCGCHGKGCACVGCSDFFVTTLWSNVLTVTAVTADIRVFLFEILQQVHPYWTKKKPVIVVLWLHDRSWRCCITFLSLSKHSFASWFLFVTLSDALCPTEEKKAATGLQRKLWELLAQAGQTEDCGSSPWLHAYRRLLEDDGVDEETQRKAMLMQLWATQVSQSLREWFSCNNNAGTSLVMLFIDKIKCAQNHTILWLWSSFCLMLWGQTQKTSTLIWHTGVLFTSDSGKRMLFLQHTLSISNKTATLVEHLYPQKSLFNLYLICGI